MKEITFDRHVREGLERGVEKLTKAVSSTLGAKGNNVIFQQGTRFVSTKDGVTVAQQVTLDDPIENAAAQIVKEAASRTARDAGDGTTSATVIANAIISQAFYYVGTKANPMELKRGIDMAVDRTIAYIDRIKLEVEGYDDIYNIARISANNDPEIGKMVANIFDKVGKNGAIRLEETQASETAVDVIEGCQFNGGYLSPNFINNQTKRTADYEKALVLITDKIFQNGFDEIKPALDIVIEKSNEMQRAIPIVIIAGDMEGEVLATLVLNRMKTKLPVVAVKAPEFGQDRMDTLDDLAAITGATVISEERGVKMEDILPEHFGFVDRVIVEQYATTFIGRNGDKEKIAERVSSIENEMEEDRNKNKDWKLRKRLATLTGGVGVIYVGGQTESEMKDSYYRIEDALAATKAAIDDGYVPGGGVAYLLAAQEAEARILSEKPSDTMLGYQSLLNGLKSPLKTIARNAGVNPETTLEKIIENDLWDFGYDALRNDFGGMIEKGIIDPAKVVKIAIKNAASVAGVLITTNCIINDKPKK